MDNVIKVPLTFSENGTTIVYPGNFDNWLGAKQIDNFIVGDYLGQLFEDDGITKKFDWEIYTDPPLFYGHKITKLAFKNRFSDEELVFIELAAIDNPQGTLAERQQAAMLRVFLGKVSDSTFIDLSRQETINGVTSVLSVMKDQLSGYDQAKVDQRINEILNNPVQEIEVPMSLKA